MHKRQSNNPDNPTANLIIYFREIVKEKIYF